MKDSSHRPGYILHYTPYRDTSFIVDLFSLDHGRLGLVARNARSGKPRTRALYQPFRPLLVSWIGDGELRTLTGIEDSGPPLPLEGASLACGYYVNELVLRLLGKEQPQGELFGHYAIALTRLAQRDAPEVVLRTFELQLLEIIGVLPDLSRCTADESPIDPEEFYRYYPANAVAVPTGDSHEHRDRSTLADGRLHPDGVTADDGIAVDGRTLLDMAALEFDSATTREQAKSLNRQLVAGQLGGRPLRSRSMFEALVPPRPADGS